uniref:Phage protein n=1 Tax=Parastrongyloides trichosuri TaxID=131310 RepID=A0A0N4ZDD3_PARTI
MYYLWNCKWKTILNGKSHTFSVDLMKIFKIKKIEYGINKNITAEVDLVKDFPDALKKLTNTDRLHRFDMKLVQFRSQKGIFCIHAYAVINSNG